MVEQWIYPLYDNHNTTNNYGWINYRKVKFEETVLSINELEKLYVIKEYRTYVNHRAKAVPFVDFMCKSEDSEHWRTYNTWRVPPIVLDTTSFSDVPCHSEISGELQLIEGHTRLGYLLALKKAKMLRTQAHKVFLLKSD